jgi:hypothetical protein
LSDINFKGLWIRTLYHRNQKSNPYRIIEIFFTLTYQDTNTDVPILNSIRNNPLSFFTKITFNNSNVLYSANAGFGSNGFNNYVGVYYRWDHPTEIQWNNGTNTVLIE